MYAEIFRVWIPFGLGIIFRSDFYSGEKLRWNLDWQTPNFAGAFLACLIVLIDSKVICLRRSWYLLLLQITLAILLANTFSRGSFAALCIGIWYKYYRQMRPNLKLLIFKVGVFIMILIFTGNIGRIMKGVCLTDRSVTNRFELWKGGLEMIAAAPDGWGQGASGEVFCNWFQKIGTQRIYATMVNSYLDVCVNYGIAALFIIIVLLVFLVLHKRTGEDECITNSRACVVTWSISNVFSCLWFDVRLWALPALSVFCILAGINVEKTAMKKRICASILASMVVCVCIYSVGLYFLKNGCLEIGRLSNSSIKIRRRDASLGKFEKRCEIYIDENILGRYPGCEIRKWLINDVKAPTVFVRYKYNTKVLQNIWYDEVVLFGKYSSYAEFVQASGRLMIVCPTSVPNISNNKNYSSLIAIVPDFDELGKKTEILNRLGARGTTIIIAKGVGQDIRPLWPNIFIGARY